MSKHCTDARSLVLPGSFLAVCSHSLPWNLQSSCWIVWHEPRLAQQALAIGESPVHDLHPVLWTRPQDIWLSSKVNLNIDAREMVFHKSVDVIRSLPIMQAVTLSCLHQTFAFFGVYRLVEISHSNTVTFIHIWIFVPPVLMYLICLSTHVCVLRERFQCSGFFDSWEILFLAQHPVYIGANTKKSLCTSLTRRNSRGPWFSSFQLWVSLVLPSWTLVRFGKQRYKLLFRLKMCSFPQMLWFSLHGLCLHVTKLLLVFGKTCIGRS